MNHDDTMPGAWQAQYNELAPLPEPLPLPYPPRQEQVVKALAVLAGMVDVWEAQRKLDTLDAYCRARIPGDTHPLANLRQYRPFNDAVTDAAAMLRHPYAGSAS